MMRTEREMTDLILSAAKREDRIRAAYLNGSRANPAAPRDNFQDYDVVYVVTETAPFLADRAWLSGFGTPLLVQEPDANDFGWGEDADYTRSYTWLMLFSDGNRIDLHIAVPDAALADYGQDSQTVPLLDKDGLLPPIPPASDHSYHVRRPTAAQFSGCCNEFWWCLNNVAKGIARDELPYAQRMWNEYVRDMLDRMLEWKIGVRTDFSVSAGKLGKYFKRFLPPADYAAYAATYAGADYTALWDAVDAGCALFSRVARENADALGFSYRAEEEAGLREYLRMVRSGEIRP
ncbi:MAG: aminoglycoside 6-adenylyltransferase [Eubacteriales bacterium]|nr:aminoglycoside 6-adenylyltransferase [Eubacteriales bacterium]